MRVSAANTTRSAVRAWLGAALGRRRLLVVWVLIVASLALYWPTTVSMLLLWSDTDRTTYTHGYLIAAVAGWILWRRRQQLAQLPADPVPLANGLVLLAAVSWLVAHRAGVQLGHQLLLPIIMWLAILSVYGRGIARLCAPPLAYLAFAIPLWDNTNDLLQAATVKAVGMSLTSVGIPSFIDGNFVHIRSGVFEVAGGCSGLHFLIVGIAIAALYGEVHRESVNTRIWLVVIGAALAILTNWIRVFLIILAGYLTDMQHYLVRVEHYRFGWVVFTLVMILFFVLARRITSEDSVRAGKDDLTSPTGDVSTAGSAFLSLASLAVVPLWGTLEFVDSAPLRTAQLRTVGGQWAGPAASRGEWAPVFADADHQVIGVYSSDNGSLEVFIAEYAFQKQGKEMVGYGNSLPGTRLVAVASIERRVSEEFVFNELEVANSVGEKSLIWYQYQVGARFYASALWAQLAYGFASLSSQPTSRVIALRATCMPSCDAARNLLALFRSDVGVPSLE